MPLTVEVKNMSANPVRFMTTAGDGSVIVGTLGAGSKTSLQSESGEIVITEIPPPEVEPAKGSVGVEPEGPLP